WLAAPSRGVDPFMGIEALGVDFVVVVVGGMGDCLGALGGGLLVGIVQSVMSTLWPEGARLMIYVAIGCRAKPSCSSSIRSARAPCARR
ncbi:hypothetical protein PPH41_45235, partial [Burkholderia gladioli]|nr:hypothetical protein [Burkholderia gladioli]